MAVESCKISSSDCNLSWEVLKNGSSKDLFRHRYCYGQKIKSKTAVEKILSESATVEAVKQLKYSPVSLTWGGVHSLESSYNGRTKVISYHK